jgi:endonuclease III
MDLRFQLILDHLQTINRQIEVAELFPTLVPKASEFALANPYAFCLATCLDRGTKAEIIWTIPFWLWQILGHLDPLMINKMSLSGLTDLVLHLPKKPRYLNAAPRTIQEITRIIVERFNGSAALIWQNQKAAEVRKTFLSVYGVGPGIASMAVLLIEKAYAIRFSDLDHSRMDIKPDVNTMRVLYRLGVANRVEEQEAVYAARYLNPAFPGELDAALWIIGRRWCAASNPACRQCPMGQVCPMMIS